LRVLIARLWGIGGLFRSLFSREYFSNLSLVESDFSELRIESDFSDTFIESDFSCSFIDVFLLSIILFCAKLNSFGKLLPTLGLLTLPLDL